MSALSQNRPPLLVALWFCGVVGGGVTKRVCREGRIPGRQEHSHGQQSHSQQVTVKPGAVSGLLAPRAVQSRHQTFTEHPLCIQPWARR